MSMERNQSRQAADAADADAGAGGAVARALTALTGAFRRADRRPAARNARAERRGPGGRDRRRAGVASEPALPARARPDLW